MVVPLVVGCHGFVEPLLVEKRALYNKDGLWACEPQQDDTPRFHGFVVPTCCGSGVLAVSYSAVKPAPCCARGKGCFAMDMEVHGLWQGQSQTFRPF